MSNEMRFKLVIDAFGAFKKELKINRLEKIFVNRFSKYSKFLQNIKPLQIIPVLPRFFLKQLHLRHVISNSLLNETK